VVLPIASKVPRSSGRVLAPILHARNTEYSRFRIPFSVQFAYCHLFRPAVSFSLTPWSLQGVYLLMAMLESGGDFEAFPLGTGKNGYLPPLARRAIAGILATDPFVMTAIVKVLPEPPVRLQFAARVFLRRIE
jgi:hypothetical protein